MGVEVGPDDDADADEEALAEVELLADALALVDDCDVLGDDVGLDVFLGFGLAVVPPAVDGCSTVLGVGLVVGD